MTIQISASVTADHTATQLMTTIPAIMQFIRSEMRSQREPSLSVPQFRFLEFLSRHPGASLSEVAEHVGVTRASASTMTDRLVQRGLVNRAEDPSERRHIMLNLTEPGSTRLAQMRDATRRQMAALLEELPPEELATVCAGVATLARLFETDNKPTAASTPPL
jgi:DNA-binding MarR family transcriptional regulator